MTDVVLVGLGAAGAVAADVLTRAGAEVVALEAGPRLDPRAYTLDELRNDFHGWLARPKAAHELPTFREDPRVEAEAGECPWPALMANAVGGSTTHYPALSARLDPWNFASRSRTVERYGAGAIPAGSTLADWPLSYEELAPDYAAVERAIGVSGEGAEHPLPPLRRSGWTELAAEAARRLGWRPFAAPAAINSLPYDGRPACTYCGFCTHNGCFSGARGSVDVTLVPRAEATGLLRVETGARAVRVERDGEGRAAGVTYVQGRRERFQPARVVLLAAFVYENVRLLLLSGLANGSGQVGRHFMAHLTPFAFGVFPGRRLNRFGGPWSQATCVEDWNADRFDHAGLGFVGGGLLTAPHEAKPIASAHVVPPSVPRFGSRWKAWLREHAQSVGAVNGQLESLAYEDNGLDLDPVARDPHGLPRVRITYRVGESERRGFAFLRGKLETWLSEAGAAETWGSNEPFLELRHCYGGTRMGDDPTGSVVDRHCLAHEVPNLGVLGASCFPTSGGHNPTLTVQALARRTARHLVDHWGSL